MPRAIGRSSGDFRRTFNTMNFAASRALQPRHPPERCITYSSEAMRQDLRRIRNVWTDCQASRDRNAIYAYLTAVYRLVAWWAADGSEVDRACKALRLQRLDASDREDPYAAIIRCTAGADKANKRTRSKWSRVMRYAERFKSDDELLEEFIKRKGGINECAARYTQRLGRLAERKHQRRSARWE
jgi:hypothetical protein